MIVELDTLLKFMCIEIYVFCRFSSTCKVMVIFCVVVPVLFWALITCLLFSGIAGWMLGFFPETFTLGEALTISQGVTFLIFDVASQILHKVSCIFYLKNQYLFVICHYFTNYHVFSVFNYNYQAEVMTLSDDVAFKRSETTLYLEVHTCVFCEL